LPPSIPEYISNIHLFVIRTKKRALLKKHLAKHGVETGIHYPYALHEQPSLAGLGYAPGRFPISHQAAREVLSLPMYPELTEQQIRAVARAVRSYYYP
jgi:dTDP-4-amino-4,6-dideoxygalactose transaminase